ncbi:hypothetical protein QM012_009280 [Aureobasidium pullulans]|uniref:Uncharacterized protein n=1 Tax=Aureobasidium pullulans TaxID=5580 RepID=A0ABR0TGF6_AURPU
MAHGNSFPNREPVPRANNEADMLYAMINNLNVKSPYRKYPPLGVPCAGGSSTFQLNLRREEWWHMLQEQAWKEKVMMQRFRLEEESKERQKQEKIQETEQREEMEDMEDEQKKQRKDSLVEEKDVAAANTSASIAGEQDTAVSAIYGSSAEEEDSEDEEPARTEQTKHVPARKTSGVKEHKEKGHKHGHKVRRVRPLGCIRTHARQGSVASCSSSRTSTSHSEVDMKEASQRG